MERVVNYPDGVSEMISEGSPVGVTRDQVPSIRNSRFPEVVGKTRSWVDAESATDAMRVAAVGSVRRGGVVTRLLIDPVTLRSVSSMDGRE